MEHEIKYAGFWRRTLATIIDYIWLYGSIYTILYFIVISDTKSYETAIGLIWLTLEWIVPFLIVIAFWSTKAATPGKMLLKTKIVDSKTNEKPTLARLLLRYFAYFVSIIPLFMGIIWVSWDKKKQGWHDKIARTVVVVKP